MTRSGFDAVVVGSGPNGLSAAAAVARAGRSVLVLEATSSPGGGARSAELTLPGFVHDICSAIHPTGAASPFFNELALDRYGLHWAHPSAPVAHPLDDGSAVMIERGVEETASQFGEDSRAYQKLIGPLVNSWTDLAAQILGPPRPPKRPVFMAAFGLRGLRSAMTLANSVFRSDRAKAAFAGMAAHAILPLESPLTGAVGMVFSASAHAAGWPLARGGSSKITDALIGYIEERGGVIELERRIDSISQLPPARTYFFDVTPRQLVAIAGDKLPDRYREKLLRFRHGPGVFKIDYALDGPIPWKAAECARSATVHVGGSIEEIALGERSASQGRHADHPFVLVAQQSLFDDSRAPAGKHTAWAYCHVPNGSTLDVTDSIESQIERFAPGFRDRVLAKHTFNTHQMEAYNPNYVGGDISGGSHQGLQLFFRPTLSRVPYRTPARGIYLCSASTPPGAGVHGMCGYFAARAALRRELE